MRLGRLILLLMVIYLPENSYAETSAREAELNLINQLLGVGDYQLAQQKITDLLTPLLIQDDSESIINAHVAISPALRKSRDLNTVELLENLYFTEYRDNLSQGTYYHLLMSLSYDYLAFARFEHVRKLLATQMETINQWHPQSEDGITSKANLLHIYGQMLVRQKNIREALDYFFEAESSFSELNPQHPSIFTIQVIVGEAYLEGFQYEKAESYLRKAVDIFPVERKDARSYVAMLLAKSLLNQNKKDVALQVINDYLANPIDPREDYFLAFSLTHLQILRALNMNDQALPLARETMQLAQKVGNTDYINEARQHLAVLQTLSGQPKQGLELIEQSIKGKRDIQDFLSLDALNDYVTILEANGRFEQALVIQKEYQEVFELLEQRIDQVNIADLEAQRALAEMKQQQLETNFDLERVQQNENIARLKTRAYALVIVILVLGFIITFVILRRLAAQNILLHRLSTIDHLTDIPNRLAFTQELERNNHQHILIADLDFLKYYNDEYGHERGDRLLQQFSKLVDLNIAPEDLVFRIGGDEFAILSNNIDSQQAEKLMKQVIDIMQEEGFHRVDVSYGVASMQEEADSHKRMALADTRMYEMKTSRKQKRHSAGTNKSA